MRAEEQVCTVNQSKQLYELGLRLPSMCWWRNDYPDNPLSYPDKWRLIFADDYPLTGEQIAVKYEKGFHLLPAFTVAELGMMLPKIITLDNEHHCLDLFWVIHSAYTKNREEAFKVGYFHYSDINRQYGASVEHINEANCRAQMVIYLLEHELVSSDKLNELR